MNLTEHQRLLELHSLIKLNGITSMTPRELNEYSILFAKSARDKNYVTANHFKQCITPQ